MISPCVQLALTAAMRMASAVSGRTSGWSRTRPCPASTCVTVSSVATVFSMRSMRAYCQWENALNALDLCYMIESRENSGYRYTAETRKAIRKRAAEMDCSGQELIELAVQEFLAARTIPLAPHLAPVPPAPAYAEGNVQWHVKLERILVDGNEDDQRAIQTALDWAFNCIRGRSKRKKGALAGSK